MIVGDVCGHGSRDTIDSKPSIEPTTTLLWLFGGRGWGSGSPWWRGDWQGRSHSVVIIIGVVRGRLSSAQEQERESLRMD